MVFSRWQMLVCTYTILAAGSPCSALLQSASPKKQDDPPTAVTLPSAARTEKIDDNEVLQDPQKYKDEYAEIMKIGEARVYALKDLQAVASGLSGWGDAVDEAMKELLFLDKSEFVGEINKEKATFWKEAFQAFREKASGSPLWGEVVVYAMRKALVKKDAFLKSVLVDGEAANIWLGKRESALVDEAYRRMRIARN